MELGCVVTLEYTKGVYIPPCIDEDEVSENDL